MKNILFILFLVFTGAISHAQDYSGFSNRIRAGAGYAHDFPGLNGYSVFAEFIRPLNDRLQAGLGLSVSNMNGYPRTSEVEEFTKSRSLDFSIYFVPVTSESGEIRIGAGYSFSVYDIRRSFPVITSHAGGSTTTWPIQNSKGRTSGFSLKAEYEYFIPETVFSAGIRASTFKAYDRVGFVGVFGGIRF